MQWSPKCLLPEVQDLVIIEMVLQLLYDEIKWYVLNSAAGGQEVNEPDKNLFCCGDVQ